MAEALLFHVAQGILSTLGSQLMKEMGLLWGVKDEFVRLQGTISTIQAVLLDAEERSAASHEVREWLRQLTDAMNDAENMLDDFSYEALRRKVTLGDKVSKEVRLFFSSSNQLVFGSKLAHRIRDMRARLDEIAAASQKFRLIEHRLKRLAAPKDRLQTHSHPPEVVVGREGDRDSIVELLLNGGYEEKVGVLPIVGIGGLGKTTLAQLVFNHERIKAHFELRVWICVSDDFDVKAIVKKIIGSSTGEIVGDSTEMDLIVDMLHEKINGKKYLLVLDDVWNEDLEKWSKLKDLLLGGSRGSRIVVTTRLGNVAKMIRPTDVYNLRGLSKADSWTLFSQMAFEGAKAPSESHKEIGEEIVARCSGVPLAIKAIGSLLYFKTTISEWASFRSKEFEGAGNILSILKISYDHLPSHLKHCFTYCCLFPKDHIINVPKLINLWMAQGYLNQQSSSGCLEDIGLEYFMDLLWRSFFQEVSRDNLGNIITCKMHDLMHDLARQVAGSVSVVSNLKFETSNKKTHHFSFHFDPTRPWKLPVCLLEAEDVRTFFLLHDAKDDFESVCKMDERQWGVFSCRLRRLRSLDLHSSGIVKVPRSISKLKHLRELDLSENKLIELLPDSITKLFSLKVLRLDGCYRLIELPKDIHHLINLSQISLFGCRALESMPCGLGQLASLHTLTRFVVARGGGRVSRHAASLDELHDMNKLRGTLEIFNLKDATSEVGAANLKEKVHLQCLMLFWGGAPNQRELSEDGLTLALEALEPHKNLKVLTVTSNGGSKFPNWLSSLTNLVEIEIRSCYKCRYIPPLHHLPHLRRLLMYGLPAIEHVDSEDVVDTTSSFFPSLEVLKLHFCFNLKGWWRTPPPTIALPSLPRLSKLDISYCPNLTSMPLFPPLKSFGFGDGSVTSLLDIIKATATVKDQTASSLPSSSSSLSIVLSQLQELRISCIQDLEFLPEELLRHMGSLKSLEIVFCKTLKALGPAIGYLTSLETLALGPSSVPLEDEGDHQAVHWQALGCFRTLKLHGMHQLVSPPKWIRHLKTLQELHISDCIRLVSLPDWLIQLTSLQRLTIIHCRGLSKRCGSNKGEDWPHIAHIPNIRLNDDVVQRNGRYLLSN